MYELSPVWVLAAQRSGRLDPWPLLDAIGGAEALCRAGPAALVAAGAPLDMSARLLRTAPLPSARPFLLAGAPGYPASLEQLPFAPPVLFYEGSAALLRRPMVAIVSSRRCTAVGRRTAAELARAVCMAGGVVVSGMAVGIDSAAHAAASVTGATVAVLGQGLAAACQAGARRFRAQLVRAGGAVLSEFLPEFHAQRFTFLQRNRVIAGLASVTVVVEAGHRSGALSTARHALAAGREVLAVPGRYELPASRGCLDLIEEGATVVRGPKTVLEAAGLLAGDSRDPGRRSLPASARALEDALQRAGTLDQLASRSGLCGVEVLRLLAELEAMGLVRREPGQRYVLT